MDEEKDEATYEGAERQTGLRQDARTLGMAAQLKQQAATDMILTARAQAAVAQSANDLEGFVEDAQLVLDEVYMELEKQCDEAQRRMATIREARKILTESFGRSSALVHERLGNAFTDISLDQLPPSLAPRQQHADAHVAASRQAPEACAGEQRREDAAPKQAEAVGQAPAMTTEVATEDAATEANVGKKALMDVFGTSDEGEAGDRDEDVEQSPAPEAADVDENLPEDKEEIVEATDEAAGSPATAVQATIDAADDLDEPDGIARDGQETTILPEIERGQGLTLENVLTTLVRSDVNAATMRAYGLDARIADEVVRARRR